MKQVFKFFKNKKPITGNQLPVTSYHERGASVLEVLLAIAIVAAITPFAYNRIAETSREIMDVSAARTITGIEDKISTYIRKNHADWPIDSEIELDAEEMELIMPNPPRDIVPIAAFLEKYRHSGGTVIESYIIFRPIDLPQTRVWRIAQDLGANAAITDDTNSAYSIRGGFGIESAALRPGDLVYRVTTNLGRDNSELFLHRMKLDDDMLNTMERDLFMARHDITDADLIVSGLLDSKSVRTWFGDIGVMHTTDLRFVAGADMDASDAEISALRVGGGIIGFKKIHAGNVHGASMNAGWAGSGKISADRAAVADSVRVGRDLYMQSSYAKSISGFAGASAYSLAVPYIITEDLVFANGFGLTISSELIGVADALQLGSWRFPSEAPPPFKELWLGRIGMDAATRAAQPVGFEKILKSGWK